MQNTIAQRISELFDYYHLSDNQASTELGISQSSISRQKKGDYQVSLALVEAILNKYQNVSAEWLMRGDGPMIKGEKQPAQDDSFWRRIVNALTDTCEDQKKQIAKLEELKQISHV